MISMSAESRNETASDIPGAGRLLGTMYTMLGRKIECTMSSIASSMGKGPAPVAARIRELSSSLDSRVSGTDTAKKLEKSCKTLVNYTRYVRFANHSC